MKQRYNDLTHELYVRAVLECFERKWKRNDVMDVMEKYGGVPRELLRAEMREQSIFLRLEAVESVACEMEERVARLMDGDEDALDLDDVVTVPRADGMTGKVRDIARLCVMHQLFGHLLYLGLQPLFKARILPVQFASIPRRGQTGLKRKLEKCLRKKSLGIRCAKKTDARHAYGTLLYETCIAKIRSLIPNAREHLTILAALARKAPGGHLIIGGYLDAWIFNFMMAFAIEFVLSQMTWRRGRGTRSVRACLSYMDDFALLGSRAASLRSAARRLDTWLKREYGMELKAQCCEVRFLPEREERARKRLGGARRAAPGLDMGGYVVHRTYTTVRKGIFRRIRRHLLRAAREAERGIHPRRARRLIAYHGYFVRTQTRAAAKRLDEERLERMARAAVAYRELILLKGA